MENKELVYIEVKKIHTVVVGSGAAGLNGAHRLRQYGVKNVALVTEDMKGGDHRNGAFGNTVFASVYRGNLCRAGSNIDNRSPLFSQNLLTVYHRKLY